MFCKTIILSNSQNVNSNAPKGILTLSNQNNTTIGKIRLYNIISLPQGTKIGLYINDQVHISNLVKHPQHYEFDLEKNINLNNSIYCALIDNSKGDKQVILEGGSFNGFYFTDSPFDAVLESKDEELERTIDEAMKDVDNCPCDKNCGDCEYKKYFYDNYEKSHEDNVLNNENNDFNNQTDNINELNDNINNIELNKEEFLNDDEKHDLKDNINKHSSTPDFDLIENLVDLVENELTSPNTNDNPTKEVGDINIDTNLNNINENNDINLNDVNEHNVDTNLNNINENDIDSNLDNITENNDIDLNNINENNDIDLSNINENNTQVLNSEETSNIDQHQENIDIKNEEKSSNLENNTQNELNEEQNQFLNDIIYQLDEMFVKYPADDVLNSIIPDSKFIKVENENPHPYVLGVIYENKMMKYIAYGVPAKYNSLPPADLGQNYQWLPLNPEDVMSDGYYLIYQNALTGKIVDLTIK